jgi:hypothetical protein
LDNVKLIKDKLAYKDNKLVNPSMEDYITPHKSPFRTRIMGLDEFGNKLFDFEQNLVVLGGAISTLEKMWNVRSPLVVDTINNICNIEPAEQETGTLPKENCVCLWGIGIGGCGDAFGSVRDVKYYEREIGQNGTTTTEMIPFRVVATEFSDENAEKYFLKRTLTDGHVAYYAKTFDSTPFIRSLWKDGEEGEDGTEVTENVYDTTRTDDIETFVEMHMSLEKDDVREWFSLNGEIEKARVNTVGLFTATPVYYASTGEIINYKDIKLFSKFNFDNEAMGQTRKTVSIIYRVYAS